jgi:hypothetical protein
MKLGTRAAALAAAMTLCAAAPAAADTVAYVDGHNLWLASPDGAHKLQVTTDGTETNGYTFPSQGHDGQTVVAHYTQFDESRRPTLHLFGPDAKHRTANVMPVYSGAMIPVYPIGLDMDWNSQAVAYGYSYCTFACQSLERGYWLTFSDNQGLYPTNPQGQSDAFFPTFYGKRIVSSDSGGSIFVQPDVAEAPFTHAYQGWISSQELFLSRAEVSKAGDMFAVEWSERGSGTAEGIVVGRHAGTVPSDIRDLCDLPVAGGSANVTFSPDGRHVAWNDDEGVKVAGVPNLAAGTETCTLSSPPVVISPTGKSPSFGGGDVGAILQARNPQQPGGPPPGGQQPGGDQPGTEPGGQPPAQITLSLPATATAKAFAKGLQVSLEVPAAGRVSVSARVSAKAARKARIVRGKAKSASLRAFAAAEGVAAAKGVVVARGSVTASGPGSVTVRLKPTAAARKAARAKRLRGARLTLSVSQGTASTSASLRLR